MKETYEQFLIDMPRIDVMVQHKPFQDSAIECIQRLKDIYKKKANYAVQIATQQTLAPYFENFSTQMNTFTQCIVDGGSQHIHYESEQLITLYKIFNLIHIQNESIKKIIVLKIEFYPETYTHKATWKSLDASYSMDWVNEWDMVEQMTEKTWSDVLLQYLYA